MAKCLSLALSLAVACLLFGGAAQAANITLGQTSIFNSNDNGNAGLLLAQGPYNLSQQATIQSLSFYVTSIPSTGGQLRLGIYTSGANNNCKGGTLQAQTAAFTPVANAWNTANVATQVLLPVGNYCLAYEPNSNSIGFRLGATTGVSAVFQSFPTFGAMPTTFSSAPNTDPNNWSFYATLATQVATITGETLSCGSSCTFVGQTGSVQNIGTVAVQENNGTFGGTLSLSDNTNFQLTSTTLPSTLQAKAGVAAGSYPLTITATQGGVSGSPFPQAFTIVGSQPPTISGVTLSGTTFPGGSATGTTIGTVGVTEQNGTFAGTLALSDTTHFQLSSSSLPSTLKTLTTDAPGNYPLTITATQSGVMGSPFPQIISGGIVGIGITGMSMSSQQFVSGSGTGTPVGQLSVTEVGGPFAVTYAITGGADAASFSTSGGWIYTVGTLSAGPYTIQVTATPPGGDGPALAKTFVITTTPGMAQQWLFLTSSQTFNPTSHGLIATNPITIETIGGGSGGAQVTAVSNDGGCGGGYSKVTYALTSDDINNNMAVVVGAAGAVNAAGGASSVAGGLAQILAKAAGGGAAPGCAGGTPLVGAGYNGGLGGQAPGGGGGGAGGSAGPHGAGGNGSNSSTVGFPGAGGGGGGADGKGNATNATASAGGTGGGSQGGAGGVNNTTPGNGAVGTSGSGSGGGGATTSGAANGGNGGNSSVTLANWDGTHGLGSGPGAGGTAQTGTGGNAGLPVGYGCGGAGFGDEVTSSKRGASSAGCPGLVVIGWNGSPPAQSITSVSLAGSSYTVGAAANTVIGTIAVGMTPTSPAFNYPTSTLAVSDTANFKVVNVGGVPTLEANATLSLSSYTTTITATQSGAQGSPFTTGTLTITGRSLSITYTPSSICIGNGVSCTIPASTPKGATVATVQGVWSNADPFTGTYAFTSPYGTGSPASGTFALSGNNVVIDQNGPGVGFDGGTTQNISVSATQ